MNDFPFPSTDHRIQPVDFFAGCALIALALSNPVPIQTVPDATQTAYQIARSLDRHRTAHQQLDRPHQQ